MAHAWTADEIRRVGRLVVDLIADHLSALPEEPVFQPVPPEHVHAFLSTPPPQDPVSPDEILRLFQDTIEPYPFGNGHPRFWGWVNSPPAVMGVFAEALAAAMNPSCAGGEAFLTGTELRGRFVLRACIVNYRSRREDIDRMLDAVRAIGRELVNLRI